MKKIVKEIGCLICQILTKYFLLFFIEDRRCNCKEENYRTNTEEWYLSKTRW